MEYKDTLNLPQTDFPMKANLVKKEPEVLGKWEKENLYESIRKQNSDKPKYVFHDGPPYANGHIHMGHALNKILKDIVVKVMSMKGYDAGFIPGWDCHGLPIEHQVGKELKGKDVSKSEIRKLCREYANKFVEIQKEEFKRLGVFADWNNPYLTMDYSYEATIVRELGKFFHAGKVYKGLKPVHWCTNCKTALAEAEVEHANHTSSSIYVKFPVSSGVSAQLNGLDEDKSYFVIWTTTPWTLPANLAICLHPDFQYVCFQANGEKYVVAKELLPKLLEEWGITEHEILGECAGKDLENIICRHPFIDRDSRVILGEHVTLEQGTGCVHTAPGHGQEDYVVGQKYGLDTYNPVNDGGVFIPSVEHFAGMFIEKANPEIIKKLSDDGNMILESKLEHSYPHCWRCRKPVIFRATPQWFISMDKDQMREKALKSIEQTRWIPAWGKERIYSMVENRPDWCISRQRAWGVPITIFTCKKCEAPLKSEEIFDRIANMVEEKGADFWFETDAKEILTPGTKCPCGSGEFDKVQDILDVWFDSGVSHAAVIENKNDLHWPTDLYLEGSDQHRGWFHSSLLESVGTRGRAPYKTVLTHGYVVDGKGRKMSKSAGNVMPPQKIIDQYGAEILRLWVASENYREDIRVSQEILKRLTDSYRKVRNTFRFMLGNCSDFDPEKDKLDFDQMMEIDQYVLYRFKQVSNKIIKAYESFEFHVFYHTFANFCVVDLSAFYLDILKDRLYTYPKNSPGRRSSQTAMYELLIGMTRLIAPVLSFTADELWSYIPNANSKESTVHLSQFSELSDISFSDEQAAKWENISALKSEVSKALELRRQEKVIGHSLDALVRVVLPPSMKLELKAEIPDLKYIFIVSVVEVVESLDSTDNVYISDIIEGLQVEAFSAPGIKCERCWNYFSNINEESEHKTICPRCIDNLVSTKA